MADSSGVLESGQSLSARLANLSQFKNELFATLYPRHKILPDDPLGGCGIRVKDLQAFSGSHDILNLKPNAS